MRSLLAAFAKNTVFANIVLVMIFIAGGLATKNMIRETFPEITLDMISIAVPYPGADPEEVEEGVCKKIEESIEGVEGIKLITGYCSENRGTIIIEVKEGYKIAKVLDSIKSRVDGISTFPAGTEKPVITDLTHRDPALLLYLSGDMSEHRLKERAEKIKDEILQIDGITQVTISGVRDYEIHIEVSEKSLREYGLTLQAVENAVRKSSLNLAGGTIRTENEEIRIRTMGRKYTGQELSSIILRATPEGEVITLGRIAHIDDGFEDDPITASVNGKRAAFITISKTKEEDSLAISKAIHKFVKIKQAEFPAQIGFDILYDITDMLRARIDLLIKNGIIGLIIVFITLWLFLNARLAFWAGMGIPVSISGALAILWALGGTINMMSLFGLIMALGIVVDDAIVVGEAIFVHRKMGKSAINAAVDGVCEVGLPVFAAVATTVITFIPLLYIGGVMGKIVYVLPIVVIACLVASLVECIMLLPAHLSHLPGPDSGEGKKNRLFQRLQKLQGLTSSGLEQFVSKVYIPFLGKILYWRYVAFCTAICILFLSIGFINGGILKFEVLPEIDGFIMNATVELPSGTPLEVTQKTVAHIEKALLRLAEKAKTVSGKSFLKDSITIAGQNLEMYPTKGPHLGGVQAVITESEERGIHSKDLMIKWEKEVGLIPGIKSLVFIGLSAGPPGDPIEVWLQSKNMDDILSGAKDLKKRLGQFDGVYQIRSDFSMGKNEIRLKLKPEARALGITVSDLAKQVYTGYYGGEAVRIQRGKDDIRVKIRYTGDERSNVSNLNKVRIRTAQGHEVPLLSVAGITYESGFSKIMRTNGMRRVMVSAGVDSATANATEIIGQLSGKFFPELRKKYPGLKVSVQGEQKKFRESIESLYVGFPLAILGIFIIIATIFRSYAQPFVILFTVPFGAIGAIIGHLFMGINLSMMSIFGIVALTGVVVNDAIVLIERVNENLAEGLSFIDALLKGGARRFRAIFLTSISTIGGLTPLILETDLQAKFLIPMALSLAAGVAFATVLTLVLLPCLLMILNDLRLLLYRIKQGVWPERAMIEPARVRHDMAIEKKT